ncbi:MAG: hypothetical protein PVF58_14060 [Candidatus Methanofastidiosia archaeon]|jgi:hypothetical protein
MKKSIEEIEAEYMNPETFGLPQKITTIQDVIGAGGGTFDKNGRAIKKDSGYFVGNNTVLVSFELGELNNFNQTVKSFIRDYLSYYPLPDERDVFVGFWVNDGKLHIEHSRWFADEITAQFEAGFTLEKYIYNCKTKESERVIH